MSILIHLSAFFLIIVSSKQIGQFLSKFNIPYITGYLFVGALAGPFLLNIIPKESIDSLRFVDELALAIIAFLAGSELYWKEIKPRLNSIAWVTAGILVVTLILGSFGFFYLTQFLPFTQGYTVTQKIALSVLGSTILLALSPASTIAVLKEARAKGPMTQTILGITVSIEVVIIILFAVSVAVGGVLLENQEFRLSILFWIVLDLVVALVLGGVTGWLLKGLLAVSLHHVFKHAGILILGYGVFAGAHHFIDVSYQMFSFKMHVEPLLIAMIAGFYITNFTAYKEEFEELLHDMSPTIYVAFFTLTGIALKLDILLVTLPIALILFFIRTFSLGLGGFIGGSLAKESPNLQRWIWLGLITQAGIALGLAKEVAIEFPLLGSSFTTLIVAVIVINEIVGPFCLKWVLQKVKEANLPEKTWGTKEALILGIEQQSIAVAKRLREGGWTVKIADSDSEHVDRVQQEDFEEILIDPTQEDQIKGLVSSKTRVVLCFLRSAEENLRVCEMLYYAFPQARLIARLNQLTLMNQFRQLGVTVVDTTSAMVNLLDQAVRVPQSIELFLHQDSERQLAQVKVTNSWIHGRLIRELKLPPDLLFLSIQRRNQSLLPNGYMELKLNDAITVLGGEESIKSLRLQIETE